MPEPSKGYQRKLGSVGLILMGAFLLIEHIYAWGGADIDDPVGHETYGMIMIIIGVLLAARRKGKHIIPLPGGE